MAHYNKFNDFKQFFKIHLSISRKSRLLNVLSNLNVIHNLIIMNSQQNKFFGYIWTNFIIHVHKFNLLFVGCFFATRSQQCFVILNALHDMLEFYITYNYFVENRIKI